MQAVCKLLQQVVEGSQWYQRSQGRDHLLLYTHFAVFSCFDYNNSDVWWKHRVRPMHQDFARFARNLIIGRKFARETWAHNFHFRMPPSLNNTCVFEVPYLSPAALPRCSVDPAGQVVCPALQQEARFEDYLAGRRNTLFFAGNTKRESQPNVRKLALLRLAGVHPPGHPNILMSSTNISTSDGSPLPACSFEAEGAPPISSPCVSKVGIDHYQRLMDSSRFVLQLAGDDVSSARVFDTWDSGALQLTVSTRYYSDVASFKCTIPWHDLMVTITEEEFVKSPEATVLAAISDVSSNNYQKMRRMWELQRAYAEDILWHLPGSRVASNIIDQAMRCLDP
mmetsp:Transcript_29690/g.83706  ORF Transcript_29690/g.83706 Transcript_29690/m.83706 type:complete len:338 (+) Transcript_29690:543-1556(+)